jgi:hypothetical protein
MKAKGTCVSRGASPLISKAGASHFITKAGVSPIPNIERRALERNISVSYAPYKARSQLGHNSGGARSALFLSCAYRFFPFLEMPSKNLVVTN